MIGARVIALAFEIAAKACFREGMKLATPIILEPIMDVEVTTPNDHVGDVVGDLNRRRGQIQNQESSGSTVIVRAHVPLKEMFGYISDLRSMTKGRASFTMQFHHRSEEHTSELQSLRHLVCRL